MYCSVALVKISCKSADKQTNKHSQQPPLACVRTGPGNPGKSLNLKNKNPGLESPGILLKILEIPGILNSEKRDCKNSIC